MVEKLSQKPILITGAHRSGTTWVGKMIGAAPSVALIFEPFAPKDKLRTTLWDEQFKFWFTFINEQNQTKYFKAVRNTIQFRYNFGVAISTIRSWQKLIYAIRSYKCLYSYRRTNLRPLVKDPHMVFSAEWLYKEFSMQPLILVRHPAAYVNSIKKLNWNLRKVFIDILQQQLLVTKFLQSHEPELRDYACNSHDLLDQASFLWKIIYDVVHKYQQVYSDSWLFVRHEDLAKEPMTAFAELFFRLNLEFSPNVQHIIQNHSSKNNPTEGSNLFDVKRNSKDIIHSWKTTLSYHEVTRIWEQVGDVAQYFYTEDEW
jgi:hypothetical protein